MHFLRDNPDQGLLLILGWHQKNVIRISFYNDTLSLTFVGLTCIYVDGCFTLYI
jgi:hypothetical protein